jgi:Mrp family chromosome partitioning ATPase
LTHRSACHVFVATEFDTLTLNGSNSFSGFLRRRRTPGDSLDAELRRSAYERALAELLDRALPPTFEETGPGCTIALVSAEARQGTTTAAANLAMFAAQRRRLRTLLIDADESAPSHHLRFETKGAPGLTELLRDETTLEESLHATVYGRLDVLPLGEGILPRGARTVAAFRRIVDRLRSQYALTVADLSAVANDADSAQFAAAVDRCVLVVDPARSRRSRIDETAARLRAAGATLAGFIFNRDGKR